MNTTKSKRWFERHPKIIFTGFLIITIFLLDFISAKFFIPVDYNSFRCPDAYFHHGLLPNQIAKNKWGDIVFDVYTNSLGFKDKESRFVPLQSEKKRILFMGDSFTEGVGMTWEKSFVGILDKEMPDVDILNAGAVSYSPKLHYLKLKYLIETVSLKFDEVYVLIDNSDVMDELTYHNFKPYDQNSIKKTGYKLRSHFFNNSYIYYSISNFINQSQRNQVTKSWNPFSGKAIADESALQNDDIIAATLDWSYKKDKYEKWGKEGLELAAQNMEKLIVLCKSNHITPTVVIYPWPNLIQRNDLNNIQVRFWEAFCQKNNIQLINLFPSFINHNKAVDIISKYFIPGDVHWNEKGNRYVAGLIKKSMTSQ